MNKLFFTDVYRFFWFSWETSPQTDSTPEASEHSGSGRIEFSSKSATFGSLFLGLSRIPYFDPNFEKTVPNCALQEHGRDKLKWQLAATWVYFGNVLEECNSGRFSWNPDRNTEFKKVLELCSWAHLNFYQHFLQFSYLTFYGTQKWQLNFSENRPISATT